ncbi:COG4 [Candida theae]|uniref:Conserved oligomeric Golgi complex subunit 4 n=1 Tax=Candida theae TaxID=1198502 RepID=A0AAD5FWR3_9ASCO|nr:COG4 [Candida theae]KAI5949972.1 COG4 [Candida theae]
MSRSSFENDTNYSLDVEALSRELSAISLQFHDSSSPNDLHDVIDSIDDTITTIDSKLEGFITLNKKKLQQDVTSIDLLRVNKLSATIRNAARLSQVLTNADELGHSLTYKIKSLDQEIGNVNETLNYVENVQSLKNNIKQINYAIEGQNWELAAQCIHAINSYIPRELVRGEFASAVIPSTNVPELPEASINNWIKQLVVVFKKQFNDAASKRDVEKLTKYFQLFPLISQEEAGLNCYAKFICEVISESSKNLTQTINSITSSDLKPGIFDTVAMQLFENVSMMLSQHGPLIKRYYLSTYPDALIFVVNRLQREVDLQIGVIADTFYDARRFDKLFQDIKLYKFPILSKRLDELREHHIQEHGRVSEDLESLDDLVPIRHVGDLILELSLILHSWALYCKFITIKYFHKPETPELVLPNIITKSNFSKKVNEKLLPAFETLYQFYFRRSLEKSITIEEVPSLEMYLKPVPRSKSPDHPPCSSVIEDLTLILNNTLRNVIQSGFPTAVKSFVTESFQVVQQDLINGYFIRNLNDNQPKYNQLLSFLSEDGGLTSPRAHSRSGTPEPHGTATATTAASSANASFFKGASSAFGSVVSGSGAIVGSLQTTSSNSPKLMNFVVYLNSVGVAQEYFTKIINNIKSQAASNAGFIETNFPFGKDAEKIKTILNQDFLDPFMVISNRVINESLINLYNQSIKQRLISMVNDLVTDANDSNYILYSTTQVNDPSLLIRFKSNWTSLTKPYLQTLHQSIWHKLLRLIVINLVNLIERKLHLVLKRFKINELGSVKLEKDMSFVINEVCEDNYQLREKFVKLTQLVLLVGMDDDEYEESKDPLVGSGKNIVDDGLDDGVEGEQEAEEYSGINWILTPQEREQIRSYRV